MKDEEEKKDNEKEKEEEKEERKVCKSWDFKEQLVFQRFDSFVERLKTIQDFCNTANQFLKLEKVCQVHMFKHRATLSHPSGGNWWNPRQGAHPGSSENPRDLQRDLCSFRKQVEIQITR